MRERIPKTTCSGIYDWPFGPVYKNHRHRLYLHVVCPVVRDRTANLSDSRYLRQLILTTWLQYLAANIHTLHLTFSKAWFWPVARFHLATLTDWL